MQDNAKNRVKFEWIIGEFCQYLQSITVPISEQLFYNSEERFQYASET